MHARVRRRLRACTAHGLTNTVVNGRPVLNLHEASCGLVGGDCGKPQRLEDPGAA